MKGAAIFTPVCAHGATGASLRRPVPLPPPPPPYHTAEREFTVIKAGKIEGVTR